MSYFNNKCVSSLGIQYSKRSNQLMTIGITLALVCPVFAPSSSDAASIYLQEQSASALGSAFAGVSAQARDASILFYNPAGMTDLDGPQTYLSSDLLFARGHYNDNGSTLAANPVGGPNVEDAVPFIVLPNFYAAAPVTDKLWLGLGVSVPFGLSIEYDDNWVGRYDTIEAEIITYDFQPSFAYQANDWFSFGGGLNIQYLDVYQTKAVFNGVTEGLATLDGDSWAVGFNAGFLIEPNDKLNIGLHYRSRMEHEAEGTSVVEGVVGLNGITDIHAGIDLPDVVSTSVSYELDNKWTMLGQFNWIGWEVYDNLQVLNKAGGLTDEAISNYDNAFSIALGAEYNYSDNLTLRGGYQYDDTPSNDQFRSAAIPDGDRNTFALGATYKVNKNNSFDFAISQTFISEEEISVLRNNDLAAVNLKTGNPSYNFVSLAWKYKF